MKRRRYLQRPPALGSTSPSPWRPVGRRQCAWLIAMFSLAVLCWGCGASAEDCARGTKLSDGVCVGDGSVVAGASRVEDFVVTFLSIEEEGKRPLYITRSMTVHLGIKLKSGPFKSDAVIGLSSADGNKHCAAGSVELVFDGGADAGVKAGSDDAKYGGSAPVQSSSGELSISKTLFVQPECAQLVGEQKATVWVAIDPMRRLQFAADKRTAAASVPTESDGLGAFFHASRWPLDLCKSSPSSGHKDNCASVLEVAASPGLDVHMHHVQPSSSVLTLKSDAATPKPQRDAHLFANATVVLYGEAFKKIGKDWKNPDHPLAQYQLDFFFMLRPDVHYADLPAGASAADVDWAPLVQMDKGGRKSIPVMHELSRQSLGKLETAEHRQLDQPLRLPGALFKRLTAGDWRRYSKFQLLACAMPGQCSDVDTKNAYCANWKEASAKGLSANNNCKTAPLIVFRHEYATKPLGGHHKQYEVAKGADDPVELEWHEDAKAEVNKCKAPKVEVRPRCVALDEHLEKSKCYGTPGFKIEELEGTCHCCYPAEAFADHLAFHHEPEVGFTLGSERSLGVRTRVWWTLHLHTKSMFEPQPLRLRSTVGFAATLIGWWSRSLLTVDAPVQFGLAAGQESYWWPQLGVLGFSLWDQKHTIEAKQATFEAPPLAAKEWAQNFCQTFCAQVVCFDVCAQVGASVALKGDLGITPKETTIKGHLLPLASAIAGGSVGLNLPLGTVGVDITFEKFIHFATPFDLLTRFIASKDSAKPGGQLTGKANYNLELDALRGTASSTWAPKWGGESQRLDLYEWNGLLYGWSLWPDQRDWTLTL
jgi:hypothetical protein